jgi:glycosyltransferase involved in cell wall biosynthesis
MAQPDGLPLVSVTLCLHNARAYIDRTLDSILAQTYSNFELVVIDDGSSDGSADRVLARRHDDRLRYVRHHNRGLGRSRLDSFDLARGKYIAFIDHDDTWAPTKLARQVEALEDNIGAACAFTDTEIVNQNDEVIEMLSETYHYPQINLSAGHVHGELIRRGCFIALPSAVVRRTALDRVGGMSELYQYVSDYDLWIRLSRLFDFVFVDAPLTRWRRHAGQYSVRFPDVAAREHNRMLTPIARGRTYPESVRHAAGDFVLGQVRASTRTLISRRQFAAALVTGAMALRQPAALQRYLREKFMGPSRSPERVAAPDVREVILDGTPLSQSPAGYFNHVAELVRASAAVPSVAMSVVTDEVGFEALRARLGTAAVPARRARLWPWCRAGFANVIVRGLGSARSRPGGFRVAEVITWRMRFHRPRSVRVAILADVTPWLLPETHTPGNVRDFNSFVEHIGQHAELIATPSECSRRDILSTLSVWPASVQVVRMPLNPLFSDVIRTGPSRVTSPPTVLCVGTIEPRKNLRRLVKATAVLARETPLDLVIIGADGWDSGWRSFLASCDCEHVRPLGFVPDVQLVEWYQKASVFVYPSLYEGFGLPVLEAMALGAIIATSDRSSLPEVAGDVAVYFNPEDEEAIIAALRRALAFSPSERSQRSTMARRRAAELTNPERRPLLPFPPYSRPESEM